MDIVTPSSMVQSTDGGFAIASLCIARRVDNIGYQGHFTQFEELQLLKIGSTGEAQWKQAYTKITDPTGRAPEIMVSQVNYVIVETSDNGYAVASTGYGTFWLFKVDSQGRVLWSRVYSLSDEQSAAGWLDSMIRTSDGGFALAGTVQTSTGSNDFWLVKVDAKGEAQWNQTYNSGTYKDSLGDEYSRDDSAMCIIQTKDGGYALAGTASLYRASTSSVVYASWMVKTDSKGNQLWNQGYDAPNVNFAQYRIVQTADGGFVIAGSENQNIYLLKTDSKGQVQWAKQCGANYTGWAKGLVLLDDGGFAVAGSWNNDFGLLRLDSSGNNLWTKTYNARVNASTNLRSDDDACDMVRTSDGAYAIVGSTESSYETHKDVFFVKTETLEQPPQPSPSPTSAQTPSLSPGRSSPTSSISPNPTQSDGASESPSASPSDTQSPSTSTSPSPSGPQTPQQQITPAASASTAAPLTSEPQASPQMQSGALDLVPVAAIAVIMVVAVVAGIVAVKLKRSKTPA